MFELILMVSVLLITQSFWPVSLPDLFYRQCRSIIKPHINDEVNQQSCLGIFFLGGLGEAHIQYVIVQKDLVS